MFGNFKPLAKSYNSTRHYYAVNDPVLFFPQTKQTKQTKHFNKETAHEKSVVLPYGKQYIAERPLSPLEELHGFRLKEEVLKYLQKLNVNIADKAAEKITAIAMLKYLAISAAGFNQHQALQSDIVILGAQAHWRLYQSQKAGHSLNDKFKLAANSDLFFTDTTNYLNEYYIYLSTTKLVRTLNCQEISLKKLKVELFMHRSRRQHIHNLHTFLYMNMEPKHYVGKNLRTIVWQVQAGYIPAESYFTKFGLVQQISKVCESTLALKHFHRLAGQLTQHDFAVRSNRVSAVLPEADRMGNILKMPCRNYEESKKNNKKSSKKSSLPSNSVDSTLNDWLLF